MKRTTRLYLVLSTILTIVLLPLSAAFARVVDRTEIRDREDGYDIVLHLSVPLRHQSHTPKSKGDELRIELRPASTLSVNDPDILDDLNERATLTWDRSSGVPLAEMVYEGGTGGQPSLTVQFTMTVEFDVRSARDLRSLIISVRAERSPVDEGPQSLYQVEDVDPAFLNLFTRALRAIEDGNYRLAIQIYTKIAAEADGKTRQKAIELLGLAYEKNGQLAHAKAEYERYLEAWPDAPEAARVRQRLMGILTAHIDPPKSGKPSRQRGRDEWRWQSYGALSQFYFRDQTTPEDEEVQVNRSSVNSGLDFTGGGENDAFALRFRSVISYDKDLLEDQTRSRDQGYISKLSVEGEVRKIGLRTEVGRQSVNEDGVFGRLDGARAEWQAGPNLRVNATFGFPVMSSKQDYIDEDRELYGASINLGPFKTGWDLGGYFVEQKNRSFIDRRAVGGEVRFTDADRNVFDFVELDSSLFATLDYDIYYDKVNVFMFLGNWGLSTKTTVNLHFDYRNTPFLTTNNAIIGQGIEALMGLEPLYTELEIEQLAQDRTAPTTSVSLGLTQQLSEHWQVNGEFSTFETEDMIASGGVAAVPAKGPDHYYSVQLIGSGIFKEGDIAIIGLRLANTERYDDYALTINTRFPVTRKFRVNPKLYTSWRQTKLTTGADRLLVRPLLRFDYRARKKLRFEFEGGMEYAREETATIEQSSTGVFVYAGYRFEF